MNSGFVRLDQIMPVLLISVVTPAFCFAYAEHNLIKLKLYNTCFFI